MIENFADDASKDIFDGTNSTAARNLLPQNLWTVARRKLDMLDAAAELKDLGSVLGNRLEKLKGALKDRYSIRINDQYRIVFKFEDGKANEVQITDHYR